MKSKIKAVCISEKKGTVKKPIDEINMKVDLGIEGDAHSGNWHRQISLLSVDSVNKAQKNLNFELKPGVFAENVLIESGICLYELPIGTRIKIGTALCEVAQIGKECHMGCGIRKLTGDCVMPREGIFAKVLEDGSAKAGDYVEVL